MDSLHFKEVHLSGHHVWEQDLFLLGWVKGQGGMPSVGS